MAEGEEEEEDLGVPGSPNPLFDPGRTKNQRQGGGGGGGTGGGARGNADNDFADALYSGADFERSKPTGENRVEVVSSAIPHRWGGAKSFVARVFAIVGRGSFPGSETDGRMGLLRSMSVQSMYSQDVVS